VTRIARDLISDDLIAIKIVDTAKQSNVGLVVKEIEAMTLLHHKNIINYHDSHLQNEKLWIAVQYLDGMAYS